MLGERYTVQAYSDNYAVQASAPLRAVAPATNG
jgi:hypothetical protein